MKLYLAIVSISLFFIRPSVLIGFGALLGLSPGTQAEAPTTGQQAGLDPALSAAIVARLQSARSDLVYTSVQESPIPGIYEVTVQNGPILYVLNGGEYFFDGSLYQVRPGMFVNLREMELVEVRRERMATVASEKMIIFGPDAETKGVLNVFTDVDCGFCRKLHQDVPALNAAGIEVRYLAFPRAGIGSPSYNKVVSAWCAEDKKEALTLLKNGAPIEENLCEDNPVAEQYLLGAELGVNGTPAIILNDGMLIPGYRSTADFIRILGLD